MRKVMMNIAGRKNMTVQLQCRRIVKRMLEAGIQQTFTEPNTTQLIQGHTLFPDIYTEIGIKPIKLVT